GLTSVDSRKWHISIERSSFIHVSKLNIKAPKDSPSTDGIRIEHSTNVILASSIIKTVLEVLVKKEEKRVEYVTITRANFYTTENGVRIKTWQGGHGYARHIRFERLLFSRVTRPIIIDQYSCSPHQHCNNHSTAVEISNILYNDLRGTTNSEIAVEISCSESVPCKNIRMKDIQLNYGINDEIYYGHPKSHCSNVVQSWDEGNVNP
ncbi:hypothetical protein Gogos_012810, partial [Gossypium gossypioides]|nr:hypothetical protein [Gossypium gossypioides]